MIRNLIVSILAAFALHAFAAVDINKASQAELEQVPGIGPALSAKILQARQDTAFKDWSDFVERVRGIGTGNAAKMSQGGLTVAGQAYAPTAAADTTKPRANKGEARKP